MAVPVCGMRIVLLLLLVLASCSVGERIPVTIHTGEGPVVMRVEVAETEEERAVGLMNRSSLGEDEGMLFLFDEAQEVQFWMKDTLLALDLLFINDGRIVRIVRGAPPCQAAPCAVYPSGELVTAVLEITGGQVEARGIEEGDAVTFLKT
jgi:uncharacterized membrane protein (UPF0127 family)